MSPRRRTGPAAPRPQLDRLGCAEVVALLLDAEERVVPAVRAQLAAIAGAAELVASRLAGGGRLLFAGAGTSGRLAAAQAAELPGTFGVARDSVRAVLAGGAASTDGAEDDLGRAGRDLAELAPGPLDAAVLVAASGSTPYTLAVARAVRAAGAAAIAVVNRAGSPLAELAEVAVAAEVGPEVLRDSTRLGAGTAQKLVLDAITTAAMVRLGHVHGDLMIDVVAANAKLRERSIGIVAEIAGCARDVAGRALHECDGNARAAVLSIALGLSPRAAVRRAAEHPRLRDALRG